MSKLRYATAGLVISLALLTACNSDDDSAITDPTPEAETPSRPTLTAPPTSSPEEQAAEELEATFREIIAAWDESKINTSDYVSSDDPGWANDLVSSWPVHLDAQIELENWTAAWGASASEQVGETIIATHDITDIEFSDDMPVTAESRACLDLTEIEIVDYDGEPAEFSYEPTQYQTWDMTWDYVDEWRLATIGLTVDEPC
ncbi:hypothetical protein G1H11_16255 [Phytoactinopolyspora alkaliphila]|uniref:Nuclear transport factor 2 family protein n=1 Tax=Phytoactinopolyspora alkaliphila TaxID=1783498 RepID=A0A6N9YPJ9_9ACTN|nr:hypothetical protein [Phytoactinopolyspora alkaliphila]NED96860.1 hypothetical protein [Phytoactinopolyspora alkaliphila]